MKENEFYNIYSQNRVINELNNSLKLKKINLEIKGVDDFVDRMVKVGYTSEEDRKIYIIGSIIYKKRNELHMTQEETCNGICSISYISNLEANKYVKINNGFIYQICERLDINYNDLNSVNPTTLIYNAYRLYINNKINELESIFNNLQSTIDVPSENLFRAFFYLINDDIVNFNRIMMDIDEIKKTLSQDEVIFMLYIMILYFIKSYNYKKAYAYLSLIKRFDLKDEYLKALVQEAMYICSMELNINSIEYEEMKLKVFYNDIYPVNKQINIKLRGFIYNATEKSELKINYLKNMDLSQLDKDNKENYYYTLAYVYLMNRHYLEGIETIIDSKIESIKMINLLGLGIIMLKNDNEDVPVECIKDYKHAFNRLCKKINSDIYDKLHLSFLELMKFELDGKDFKFICDFIKYRYLPLIEDMQYLIYKKYIDARYLYLLGKLSRYKDAYKYCMDSENKLKNYDFYYIINSTK